MTSVFSSALLLSRSIASDSLRPHGLQHAMLSCPSPSPGACSSSYPCVGETIQSSDFLSSPSPPAFNLSQLQGLFQWVISSLHVAKALELQLQHQFFQWIFRTDFLLGLTDWTSLPCKGLSRVFSSTTVQKHQLFSIQLSLWSNSHIHDYSKNHTLTWWAFVSNVSAF